MNANSTRIALVTGSSRGLGKSTALKLGAHGHDVIVTYKTSEPEALDVVRQIEAMGHRSVALHLDVAASKSFDAFAVQVRQRLQQVWRSERFDDLVNNAGIGINASIAETTEEQFDQLSNVHLKGTFFLTQKLLPLINDGGRIVNTSTGLTRFAFPGYSVYAAMKGGIEVLTRYMAKELAPRGITVNTIAPGAIETDFRDGAIRDDPQAKAQVAAITALGRVGLPDDVGDAVAALLSGGNHWVTGQRIEVSGGMLL